MLLLLFLQALRGHLDKRLHEPFLSLLRLRQPEMDLEPHDCVRILLLWLNRHRFLKLPQVLLLVHRVVVHLMRLDIFALLHERPLFVRRLR